MEDHTTTDSTLRDPAEVRADFPHTGAVLQAYLRRTEADCRDLATAGSRVRLCKGAYKEPESVAFQEHARRRPRPTCGCLTVLMAGDGYPMIATHDPRLVAIAGDAGRRHGRGRRRSSTRCSTASARTSSAGWPAQGETGAGLRAVRRRSGTATSCAGSPSDPPTSRSSCARWRPTVVTPAIESRSSAPARSARRCCPGCCAPGRPADDIVVTARRAERAEQLAERYGVRAVSARRGRADRRRADPRGQAAGHGARCWTSWPPHVAAGPRWSSRWRPASRPRSSRRGSPTGTPVVRVMTNTPVLVDEAMSAHLRRRAREPSSTSPLAEELLRRSARCSGCPSRSRTR